MWFGLMLALGAVAPAAAQQNVMLIIADDCGVDLIGAYGEHPGAANTPVLDQLAADGILFRNAWANPSCSPTRSTLLTGRYAFRTGIGRAVNWFADTYELYEGEVSLPDALAPTHDSAAVGKWHISIRSQADADHPNLLGFDEFHGNITIFPNYISDDYYDFEKVINGATTQSTTYSTTDIVDDALSLISSFNNPWFLWVAMNAPHAPFHKPPPALHTYNLPPLVSNDVPLHGRAMLEAMDTEIGRLFASMDPQVLADTLIIFVGDNGTDNPLITPPWDSNRGKNTVFEGGVNVPMIIKGPGVAAGAECAALVSLTDIFATVAEWNGVASPTAEDSVSMVPYFSNPGTPSLRPWVYSELFEFNGYGPYSKWERVLRDERFKLNWEYTGSLAPTAIRLYDLDADPFELVDLLAAPLHIPAQIAYGSLTQIMSGLMPTWMKVSHGLAGTDGVPHLTGSGNPTLGNPITLALSSARPNTLTALVIGVTSISAPLKGGVIVPKPDLVFMGFTVDALGNLDIGATWPANMPTGQRLHFQHWVSDPAGPDGLAASNALILTAP
jgi:arylsulfatase A-like enzyme